MKYPYFLIYFMLISTIVMAQTDTTKWLYQLDFNYQTTVKEQQATLLLKLINPNGFRSDFFLGETLKKEIENENVRIYKDANYTIPYLNSAFDTLLIRETTDTIITFDPETFAETMKIVKNIFSVFFDKTVAYQLNQYWSIDSVNHQLQSTIQDYAIVEHSSKMPKELFYLHNDQTTGNWKDNWNEDNIIWKVRKTTQGLFKHKAFSDHLLQEAHLKQHKLLYRNQYGRAKIKPIDYNFVQEHFTSWSDTVNIRRKEVVNVYPILEKVTQYSIVQEFSFNKATKTFSSRVIAVAPIGTTAIYSRNIPLFWIVYEDDYIPFIR